MRPRNEIICTSNKDMNIITQPDLSRTVRQILRDTAQGLPGPTPLTSTVPDSRIHKSEELHKLHVCEDRFDAINRQRQYIKQCETQVVKNKNELERVRSEQEKHYHATMEELGAMRAAQRNEKRADPPAV